MDWKRAKTILIIMFLVINMFLSYQLISMSRNQYKYTSNEELASIQKYLSGKNIILDTEIPDRVPLIPSLRVRYSNFDVEQVKKLLFMGNEYNLTELDEGFILSTADKAVEVRNGIYLTYKNHSIKIKQSEVKKEKCLSHIDKFVEDMKLNTGHKYIKTSEIQNGYMRVVFGQQYKNVPVENSQIEIIATEEGVVEARINWFEWIKPDKRYNITTPVVAMLKAYENKKEGTTAINIKQIRQGYYFNIDRQKASEDKIPLEGTVFPMWVILSDKSQIYINAYNEKIEKVQ